VTYDATETFARLLAQEMAREHPDLVVAKMAKSLRARKVFIDWSQNADYKTTVAVYSLRAQRDRPYVSMPLRWREVQEARDLDFEPEQALRRLARAGDLFAPLLEMKQKLPGDWRSGVPAATAGRPGRGQPAVRRALPAPGSQSGRRLSS
jgi:bifunctional non-homologous end joining protein LigD